MRVQELYDKVTQQIIRDLEAGTIPWTKPWKSKRGGIMPHNAVTKRGYQGINIPILWHAQQENGYPSAAWLTYQQAQDAKAQVRKGEKSTTVVFTRKLIVKGDDELEKQIAMLKTFNVFNVAQIDGLPEETPAPELTPEQRDDAAVRFIMRTKAHIIHGGNMACYVPSKDFIVLPHSIDFESYEHYLATGFHELVHWSGSDTRLKRDLRGRFGSDAYAAEELIAELGAAFLCAHLEVQGQLRHADYLASWLAILKKDNRAIFTAASKASQAVDYLRSFSDCMHTEEAA
jgi:antirestriction protein ArdC